MFQIDLVKYPDVFLRSKSHKVEFPLDDKTTRLIKWMTKAMYQHHGIGLAAVQVGYLQRIFVMDCTRSRENPKAYWNTSGEIREMWGRKWYELIKKIGRKLDESQRLTTDSREIH